MAFALRTAPLHDVVTPATSDVLMVLGYTSWGGAVRRGHIHPEDQLTLALMRSERVGRMLVCNPYRSRAAGALRALTGPRDAPFPADEGMSLHEPRRLRRRDPTDVRGIERQCASYEASVRRRADQLGLQRPAVVTSHPLMFGFGRFDWAGPVTYYANDDLSAHPPLRAWWPAYEESYERARRLGRRAVALTARSLKSVSPSGPSAIVPSGIDPAEWHDPGPSPAWFRALPGPRLLYVGTLDERLDLAAVGAVAEAFAKASVVLAGRCPQPRLYAELQRLPNVTIHPEVGREELAGLVAGADVGLIPHVVSEQTRAMSPLKLYEYLAAGVPVAAVDLPGIARVCPARSALARVPGELPAAVGRALALGRCSDHERRRFIAENSWEERFEHVLDVVLEG